MEPDLVTERVARNQAIFRDANEQIEQSAESLGSVPERVPFICECPEPTCTAIALLSLADYEMVRSRGNWFLVVPGHEVCSVAGEEVAKIGQRYDAFTLMEKLHHARAVAEELDPRA